MLWLRGPPKADNDNLIIGQQRRVRTDRFVKREDVELGAEDVGVVHRDEFKFPDTSEFQMQRCEAPVGLVPIRRGG
jgi:hypothetical protein